MPNGLVKTRACFARSTTAGPLISALIAREWCICIVHITARMMDVIQHRADVDTPPRPTTRTFSAIVADRPIVSWPTFCYWLEHECHKLVGHVCFINVNCFKTTESLWLDRNVIISRTCSIYWIYTDQSGIREKYLVSDNCLNYFRAEESLQKLLYYGFIIISGIQRNSGTNFT